MDRPRNLVYPAHALTTPIVNSPVTVPKNIIVVVFPPIVQFDGWRRFQEREIHKSRHRRDTDLEPQPAHRHHYAFDPSFDHRTSCSLLNQSVPVKKTSKTAKKKKRKTKPGNVVSNADAVPTATLQSTPTDPVLPSSKLSRTDLRNKLNGTSGPPPFSGATGHSASDKTTTCPPRRSYPEAADICTEDLLDITDPQWHDWF